MHNTYKVGQEVNLYTLCRSARDGQYHFRFEAGNQVYTTRGNGWYGNIMGYDGGPWYAKQNLTTVLIIAKKDFSE